jgi:sarcosine/dimethylglycine N-methyltransferase
MTDEAAIRSMPLYTHLDRIEKGLAAQGIGRTDAIPPERLFPLDQWHYHGTEAIRAAAEQLSLGPGSRVLDVGSGIGGPARYLAHTYGCSVTALELQPELNAIAVDLTQRCGLADRVSHVCGDALVHPIPDATFDAVVSWLAVLHIPDRPRLFGRLARVLRPGGGCLIEDLCMRTPFAPKDLSDLRHVVYGMTVTSIADYANDLQGAGFSEVVATDITSDWAPYATVRLAAWRDGHLAYAQVHGEGAYAAQERFYAVIAHLYETGSLGGVRATARVP